MGLFIPLLRALSPFLYIFFLAFSVYASAITDDHLPTTTSNEETTTKPKIKDQKQQPSDGGPPLRFTSWLTCYITNWLQHLVACIVYIAIFAWQLHEAQFFSEIVSMTVDFYQDIPHASDGVAMYLMSWMAVVFWFFFADIFVLCLFGLFFWCQTQAIYELVSYTVPEVKE